MTSLRVCSLLAIGVLATACDAAPTSTPIASPSAGQSSSAASTGQCHTQDGLPDPTCTPGVANTADISQATIDTTICQAGYTSSGHRSDGRSVRPPVEYTDNLKQQGIVAYGYGDTNPADYEEDHLIPLELGGDGYAIKNLWPQPRYGQHPASEKDATENRLHGLVCSHALSLAAAQLNIAANWETALGLPSTLTGPSPALPSPTPVSSFAVTITTSTYGSLAATTLSGANCTAKAKLPSGDYSKAQGLQGSTIADSGGNVSWTYRTSSSTHKGTGTHFVTCTLNGQTASGSAPFTV